MREDKGGEGKDGRGGEGRRGEGRGKEKGRGGRQVHMHTHAIYYTGLMNLTVG
jgi:hypothetical protein